MPAKKNAVRVSLHLIVVGLALMAADFAIADDHLELRAQYGFGQRWLLTDTSPEDTLVESMTIGIDLGSLDASDSDGTGRGSEPAGLDAAIAMPLFDAGPTSVVPRELLLDVDDSILTLLPAPSFEEAFTPSTVLHNAADDSESRRAQDSNQIRDGILRDNLAIGSTITPFSSAATLLAMRQ
jgi:hypothetical protein